MEFCFQIKIFIALLLQLLLCVFYAYGFDQLIRSGSRTIITRGEFMDKDMFFEIVHPEELQYTYKITPASGFGSTFKRVYREAELVLSDPLECCSLPFNHWELRGSVALVVRGSCSFLTKAVFAEKAGAIAVIISDDDVDNDNQYMKMVDDETKRETNIPAVFLLGRSGYHIVNTLRQPHGRPALINIPLNVSSLSLSRVKQPPWVVW